MLLSRLHSQYDQIREPWRFLTMCALTWPAIIVISSFQQYDLLWGCAVTWLFFLLTSRVLWIHYRPKPKPKSNKCEFVVVDVDRGDDGELHATETERFVADLGNKE